MGKYTVERLTCDQCNKEGIGGMDGKISDITHYKETFRGHTFEGDYHKSCFEFAFENFKQGIGNTERAESIVETAFRKKQIKYRDAIVKDFVINGSMKRLYFADEWELKDYEHSLTHPNYNENYDNADSDTLPSVWEKIRYNKSMHDILLAKAQEEKKKKEMNDLEDMIKSGEIHF